MRLSEYLFQKASVKRIPLNVGMELSPVCNFSCKMCYVRKTEAQIRAEGKALIPWDKWLELARELKEAGTLYILLTGGEPFLYPNFRKLYEGLHAMGFLIMINTNGTLIDEETMQWLKAMSPYRVNLTLYGASPETYGRICGNPKGYDRAMYALRALKEAGIPTVINASMIPENAEDMEAIADVGEELGLNTHIGNYMFPPVRRDAEETDSRFTPEESAKMYMRKAVKQWGHEGCMQRFCHFFKTREESNGEDWGSNQEEEHMRCRAGRSSFWIAWDGTMSACGILDFPKSYQAFDGPILDKWKELTQLVREATVMEGCRGCSLRDICNACVALINAETGTVNEKAPYLCRLAECIKEEMRAYLEEHT